MRKRSIVWRIAAIVFALVMMIGMVPETNLLAKTTVKKIKLNKKSASLKVGQKLKLKAKVTANKATKVKWKSSKKTVATVSSKGVVKAKAAGKTNITARAGVKKATCKVTVKKASSPSATKNPATSKPADTAKASSAAASSAVVSTANVSASKDPSAPAQTSGSEPDAPVKTDSAVKTTEPAAEKETKAPEKTAQAGKEETAAPEKTKEPTAVESKEPEKTEEPKPEFSLKVSDFSMKVGEEKNAKVTFEGKKPENTDLIWESSEGSVACVVSTNGDFHALTPGKTTVTVVSEADSRVTASFVITVVDEGLKSVTVKSVDDLLTALGKKEANFITLESDATKIDIPAGDYSGVSLVVDAPKATVTNAADFKSILVKSVAKDTWVEKSGNNLYFDKKALHLVADEKSSPNLTILGGADSVTVENNGDLQSIIVSKAAEIVVSGNSIAKRVRLDNISCNRITTYLPLDITSTTKFNLVVGKNGEQTAVRVKDEDDVPNISGIGTISVTIEDKNRTDSVIAENDGSLGELPKTSVSGTVIAEKEDALISGKVYLVPYSVKMDGENTSVYLNKADTKTTQIKDHGDYAFSDVQIGNYVVVVEADGYQLITTNIFIDANYEDRDFVVDDILISDAAGAKGGITGELIDVQTGVPITADLKITLRKGMNNITTNEVGTTAPDSYGKFSFSDLTPGQYTIAVRDERDAEEIYGFSYQNVSVLSGTTVNKTILLSKELAPDSVRFVLTWGDEKTAASADLDIYVYGPDEFYSSEFTVHRDSEDYYKRDSGYTIENYDHVELAELDIDDTSYNGPETVTVKNARPGLYKIFVKDYTEGGTGNKLFKSYPVIKIYVGTTLKDTINMRATEGGVWYAGDYDAVAGRVYVVDEAKDDGLNNTVKAEIGTVINKLQQFKVSDEEKFAPFRKRIDDVGDNYHSEKDNEKLDKYLKDIEGVYDDLKAMFTISRITGDGLETEEFGEFKESHSIGSLDCTSQEDATNIKVEMSGETDTKGKLENYGESSSYWRIYLYNDKYGVYTYYYTSFWKPSTPIKVEHWVRDIEDPDDSNFKRNTYTRSAETGGYRSSISHDIVITLYEEIEETTDREFRDEAEDPKEFAENWGNADLVLHLRNTENGETLDYPITYKPIGANLLRIEDANNIIVEQTSRTGSTGWTYDHDTLETAIEYNVIGENKEMGNTWKPIVEEGAKYELSDVKPDDIYGGEKIVTVTRDNGAKRVYRIYYFMDSSDAELIGITDDNNLFTEYEGPYSNYIGDGNTYSINIKGVNSEFGKNLVAHVKAGATAEIKYADGSVSFNETSDAMITVKGAKGSERIYYIGYSKSDIDTKLKRITSDTNTLKLVYVSYGSVYITGERSELGDDVILETYSGYSASYDSEEDEITVTNKSTGEEVKTYSVYYTQDISGLKLASLKSKLDPTLVCSIGTSYYTSSQADEKYYIAELKGNTAGVPSDLEAVVSYGAEADISIKDYDLGSYDSDKYKAKITVSDKRGNSLIYYVRYRQDDSGAEVKGISDDGNEYAYSDVSSYTSSARNRDTNEYDNLFTINVIGDNKELGDTYKLDVETGTSYKELYSSDDEDYPYIKNSGNYTKYDKDRNEIYGQYASEKVVEVTAANGAKRLYRIIYGQNVSGIVAKEVVDEKNNFISWRVSTSPSSIYDKNMKSHEYYVIELCGENAGLGKDFELVFGDKDTEVVSTVYPEDEDWAYSDDFDRSFSVQDKESGNSYTVNGYIEAEVMSETTTPSSSCA